ncbi:uncharacterized protein [Clytia hemisphaerica]|uniref:Cnidarian restricted protein n=1 Tax=Clytia hemisphaerica TaxID=252671 RepID=A0A7M5X232_9CNID
MWVKQLSSPVLVFIFILLFIQNNHGSEVDSEEEAASFLLQKSLIKARMKINRHVIHRRQALYHHFVELEDNFFEENDADPDNDEDGDGCDVDREENIRLETRNLTSDAISDSTKNEFENPFDDEDIEESGAHRPSDDPNVAYTTLTRQNDDKSIETGLKDGLQAKVQHPVLKRNHTTNNTKRHHKNNNQSTTVIKDLSTKQFIQSKTYEPRLRENRSIQNEHDPFGKLKRNTTFPRFLPSDRRRSNSTLGTGISDSENSKTTKIQESKPMLPININVKKDFKSNKTHGDIDTDIDNEQDLRLTNRLKSNAQLRTRINAIKDSHLTNRSKSNGQQRTDIGVLKDPHLTNRSKSNAQLRTGIDDKQVSRLTNTLKSKAQLRTDINAINGPVFGDEIIHQTSIAHAPCQPQPGCNLMLIPNTVPSHKNEEKYLLSQAHALKQNAQLMSMQADILEHEVTSIKGGSGQHVMTVEGGHPLQGLHAHNMRLHNDYFNVDKPVHLPSGHHGHGPEHGGTEDLIHNAEHYKEGDSHDGGGSLKVEGGSKIQSIGTGYPQYNLPTKPMGGGGASGAAGASSSGGLFEFVRPLPPAAGPNPYEVLTSATLGQDYPGVSQKQSASAMGFNEAGGAGMQYEVLTSANLGKELPGVTQEQSAAAMGFNNGGGGAMVISKPMKFVVSLKGLKVKEQKAQKLINFTVKRDGGKSD